MIICKQCGKHLVGCKCPACHIDYSLLQRDTETRYCPMCLEENAKLFEPCPFCGTITNNLNQLLKYWPIMPEIKAGVRRQWQDWVDSGKNETFPEFCRIHCLAHIAATKERRNPTVPITNYHSPSALEWGEVIRKLQGIA